MIRLWLNWRTLLAFVAIMIIIATVFYSNYLSKKISQEEKQKVEAWVEAQKTILQATDQTSLNLASKISTENDDIPIIETSEKDSVTNNYLNLDSTKVRKDPNYLKTKLKEFKQLHAPIILVISDTPYLANHYYYGESQLRKEVQYYPIVQLVVVGFFIIIIIVLQRTSYRSLQNKMWAGMAKETAHQLGTPVTSLQGWLEMLKTIPSNHHITPEIEKDIERLQLISDRFGKIGSHPHLEPHDVLIQVQKMVDYIKKRAGANIQFHIIYKEADSYLALISTPLFDWVIENLLKNALDAMEGKGNITLRLQQKEKQIAVDITDTGKGIPAANWQKIFTPGFTTKKRGWGLGLTLTKRIIEQYHKGSVFVKWSESAKGTTFRILLDKA